MEKNNRKDDNLEASYHLAKLLLRQGTLHSFHEQQLASYIFAASDIICDGEVSLDMESRVVTYNLKTKKNYKRINKSPVTLGRIARFFNKYALNPWKYNRKLALAEDRLKTWTSTLLWGDETTVEVKFDERD